MAGRAERPILRSCRGMSDSIGKRRFCATREASRSGRAYGQPDARAGQAGLPEVADRPVVGRKPRNGGGAKGPEFTANGRRGESQESGDEPQTSGDG